MHKDKIITSNWAYLIWFCFYFTLSVLFVWIFTKVVWIAFFITAFCYFISLLIAFSPIGEWMMRAQIGAKEIVTRQDIDYLYPIFYEVHYYAKWVNNNLSNSIKLYLIDDVSINAYAIGNNSIALTYGAVYGLSPDDLKGLIAHEIGHLSYFHTRAGILNVVGNGFFSLYIIIANGINGAFLGMAKMTEGNGCIAALFKGVCYLVAWTIKGLFYLVIATGNLLLSFNNRQNEFLADEFAFYMGYGQHLVHALYLVNRAFPDGQPGVFSKLYNSHPYMSERIARLEASIYR